jgi:putative transposase
MSTDTKNLNHSTWECQYHVVFTPKYRTKVLYGMIRRDLKDVLHRLAKQKECVITEGALMPDHVHMLICIPPKHSVALSGISSGPGATLSRRSASMRR